MRKIFLLFFALCISFTLFAADFTVDDISYTVTSDNEPYTVSGIRSYGGYIGSVSIPATVNYNNIDYSVTSIGAAFSFCISLTSVNLPASIASIDESAFF